MSNYSMNIVLNTKVLNQQKEKDVRSEKWQSWKALCNRSHACFCPLFLFKTVLLIIIAISQGKVDCFHILWSDLFPLPPGSPECVPNATLLTLLKKLQHHRSLLVPLVHFRIIKHQLQSQMEFLSFLSWWLVGFMSEFCMNYNKFRFYHLECWFTGKHL